MKIRTSFVSNSSSSSFIIGVGIIPPEYAKEKNLLVNYQSNMYQSGSDLSICILGDLRNPEKSEDFIKVVHSSQEKFNETVSVSSFNDWSYHLETVDLPDDTIIGVYSYYGGEGDHAFYNDEYEYEADYDIDQSFFNKEQYDMIDTMRAFGWDYGYGAGRDG